MLNQAFYLLISEVSVFHFCHILLFFRNESLNPDQTQKEIITQGCGHQEEEPMGVISGVNLRFILGTDYHNAFNVKT